MMNWNFEKMYALFSTNDQKLLLDGKWGIERELQRVNDDGDLALTPHPAAFGDKIRNREITTDFSESQMELITPPFTKVEEVDRYLKLLHEKAWAGVGNEYLWPLSMPPRLPEEELIPIARFNPTEEGKSAYIYRQGLANRYGKKMQMICGIHFNFSFGKKLLHILYEAYGKNRDLRTFSDELYFAVARNFLRYRWLLVYLFGASPSCDDTYDIVLNKEVEKIRKCCPECCSQYDKYATSLRVSRFGYTNPVKIKNTIFYNSKEEYVQEIRKLLSKRSSKFTNLEVQLNKNILQKDSEFYSPIRLKQIVGKGESQVDAINQRGVEYVEVRILDINPFEETGISLEQMHFLQVFMLFCLFSEHRSMNGREMNLINNNHHLVALSGRRPGLMLNNLSNGKISLKEWGKDIFDKLHLIAELLDKGENENSYSLSVQMEYQKLMDMSLLPSSMIRSEMDLRDESYLEFGMRITKKFKEEYIDKEEYRNNEEVSYG